MLQAIVNGCIFDGESVHEHKAVLIEGEHIVAVVDPEQVPADIGASYDLEGGMLIPGFIDLQVNGGGGVLLTAGPNSRQSAHHRCCASTIRYHRLSADADYHPF